VENAFTSPWIGLLHTKRKKVNSNFYEIRDLWHKIGNLLENLLKNRELSTKQYMVTVDKITVYTLKSASPLIYSFKPKN
jgi:hypothetical protein